MTNKEIMDFLNPILNKIKIYKQDLYWGGNQAETNILNDTYYHITGVMPMSTSCNACTVNTLNRVVKFIDEYEYESLQVTDKKNKKK
jgi:hypothetical protein